MIIQADACFYFVPSSKDREYLMQVEILRSQDGYHGFSKLPRDQATVLTRFLQLCSHSVVGAVEVTAAASDEKC